MYIYNNIRANAMHTTTAFALRPLCAPMAFPRRLWIPYGVLWQHHCALNSYQNAEGGSIFLYACSKQTFYVSAFCGISPRCHGVAWIVLRSPRVSEIFLNAAGSERGHDDLYNMTGVFFRVYNSICLEKRKSRREAMFVIYTSTTPANLNVALATSAKFVLRKIHPL